jgi:hypothetical protein
MRFSPNDWAIDYTSPKGHTHIHAGPFADRASAFAAFNAKAKQLSHSTLRLRRGSSVYAEAYRGNVRQYERPRAFSIAW